MQEDKGLITNSVATEPMGQLPTGTRLFFSIIFLIGAIVYTLSPIDIIPDLLGPIGWVDDILLWVIVLVVELHGWLRRRKRGNKPRANNLRNRDGFFTEVM